MQFHLYKVKMVYGRNFNVRIREVPGDHEGGIGVKMVFTNENCIGCNKCIRSCPVLTANVTKDNKIEVDPDKCIMCGACFDNCHHEARDYEDDTEVFLNDLRQGKQYTVIVAPAFAANYPDDYKKIYGYLKSLGVSHIYSVSHGADITTWAYIQYIKETGKTGLISQPCPAVINYIEKYQPELISMLMPIHSPMMCEAVYLKKYKKVTEELVFLSPCIAKKSEITDRNTKGYVKYNVTYKKLMEAIGDKYKMAQAAEEESTYGLGARYPKPGGLKECVHFFLGNQTAVLQVEGEKEAYHFLKEYAQRKKNMPFLVDILNCQKGCLRGTGTDPMLDDTDIELAINKANGLVVQGDPHKKRRVKQAHQTPWDSSLSLEERWSIFDKQFARLDVKDFMRAYDDKKVSVNTPTRQEEDGIFNDMLKTTQESRYIDCCCCGYATCKDMVKAIYNGTNQKENCIHYTKDLADMEKQEIEEMHQENLRDQEMHRKKLEDIIGQFQLLDGGVDDMASANEMTAKDATNITQSVDEICRQCEEINQSLSVFSEFVGAYSQSNEEIADVATQTNLLSLNASIEAARAGEAGRGFAVVAEAIRDLSDTTKQLIEQNTENSEEIIPKVDESIHAIKALLASIESMNEKITNIAATTEEISAQSESIQSLSDAIRKSVEEL